MVNLIFARRQGHFRYAECALCRRISGMGSQLAAIGTISYTAAFPIC